MNPVIVSLTVFAALLAPAGPVMSHGCDDHLPLYLRGYYEGGCDESTELAQGHGEARGADSYVGEWVKGKPSGRGVYTWENGARYEGEFKNGKVDGNGLYISAKGVRYQGGFVNGKLRELMPPDCPSTPGPLNC
jgi:MORN repeat